MSTVKYVTVSPLRYSIDDKMNMFQLSVNWDICYNWHNGKCTITTFNLVKSVYILM